VRGTIVVWMGVALDLLAQPGYGLMMTGRVVDRQARPVAGAEVAVCEQMRNDLREVEAKLIAPIARTGAEGQFRIEAQVTRQYDVFIVARKPGYALAWDGLNYSLNNKGKGVFHLVLEPPCVLTGQVADPNGKAVAGVQVQAVPVTSYLDRLRQRPIFGPPEWFTVRTDSQGTFRFEQFAADVGATFRVRIPGRESVYTFRPQRMNACGYEVWRPDIKVMLRREGAIQGIVQDSRGRPVVGVDLLLSPGRKENAFASYPARRTRSDTQGVFRFEGVPGGFHRIDLLATKQGPDAWIAEGIDVSVQTGRTTEGVVFQVREGNVLVVTVLTDRTERPVPGARVSVGSQTWGRGQPVLTDAQGVARVRVPAGFIHVYVGADRFSRWDGPVEVMDGQTVPCEVRLTPVPRVTGRVLDPNGRPVGDAAVSIQPFGDHAYTDTQGMFDAAIEPRRADQGELLVARDARRGLTEAASVADTSKLVEVKLGPAWTLVGRVADGNGVGIPAARVTLSLHTRNCLCDVGVEVLTDRDGRFEMRAVPPVREGFDYRLSVAAADYGPKEYQRISPSGPPGASVDIGTTELPPADQSISGTVVDADGLPAARVPIFVNGLAGVSQPSKATATNGKGEFAITRLCRGPIRLQASFDSEPGGAGFLSAEVPARDVKIVLGQKRTHTPETSIRGKPLPDLKELGLSSTEVNDKPVLLCFCDIDQRPSRRCLSDLPGKTETLAAHGVTLVIVQVSQTDLSRYQIWLKDAGIVTPIHVFAGDFQARRAVWGVAGLPWLVLADKDHIVRAEGFGLDELESKIRAAEKE
jgi:protocatechuate 3,4-dioxygenase beta subunit